MNPYMMMWPGYGWPQPPGDPLEQIRKTMDWLKGMEDEYKKKNKPPEKGGLSSFEVFVIMTLLSPFVGHIMEKAIELAKTF